MVWLPLNSVPSHGRPALPGIALSSLACSAAIEIDNLIAGQEADMDAIRAFAEAVNVSDKGGKAVDSGYLSYDPAAVVIVKQAIDDSLAPSTPVVTIDQLADETHKIRESLIRVASDPEALRSQGAEELSKIRGFCLSLSRSAAAQSWPIVDFEPTHPYRS